MKNKKTWLIISAVVIALAALFVYRELPPNYDYKYANLTSFQLRDPKNHAGMSILKPIEFMSQPAPSLPVGKSLLKPVEANLIQKKKIKGAPVTLGGLSLDSVPFPSGSGAAQPDLPLINQLMLQPSSLSHPAAIAPLQNYVTFSLNPDSSKAVYKLRFGKVSQFTNPYITKNSWSETFSAYPMDGKGPGLDGMAVEAYGSGGHYFAVIYVIDSNWQSNQTIWQKIINSLKIDQ